MDANTRRIGRLEKDRDELKQILIELCEFVGEQTWAKTPVGEPSKMDDLWMRLHSVGG